MSFAAAGRSGLVVEGAAAAALSSKAARPLPAAQSQVVGDGGVAPLVALVDAVVPVGITGGVALGWSAAGMQAASSRQKQER